MWSSYRSMLEDKYVLKRGVIVVIELLSKFHGIFFIRCKFNLFINVWKQGYGFTYDDCKVKIQVACFTPNITFFPKTEVVVISHYFFNCRIEAILFVKCNPKELSWLLLQYKPNFRPFTARFASLYLWIIVYLLLD